MNFDPILPASRGAAMRAAGLWDDRVLDDYFGDTVARMADKAAVIDFNTSTGRSTRLTYAELDRRVSLIAANLSRLGIAYRDVVSCQLPNWWELTALTLACARIGAVINPLMPIFRQRELTFMLSFAETKLFVVPGQFRSFDHAEMARGLKADLPSLDRILVVGGEGPDSFDTELLAPASDMPAGRKPRGDDIAQLLFTSGTTGEPKGAMHTWNTLLSIIRPYIQRLHLTEDDVVLMASPLAHQTGFMYGLVMPVMLGASAVLQDIWGKSVV